jgi:phosphate transport system protein
MYMLDDPRTSWRCLKVISMAKGVERVGDHASNIAEMVVFQVRGEDIWHGTNSDS